MKLRGWLVAVACLGISAATAGAIQIDRSGSVFIILMENHNWSSIHGSASAPYINNTLLPMASYAEQYFNPPGNHPSEPNYLWLEAGTGFGITNDNPPSSNHQMTTNHLVTRLKNSGISWKTYQENITGSTCPLTDTYPYAVKHNPFAFFDDVVAANCTTQMRPLTELPTDLANGTVAHYNFITPNIINDMHDGTIAQGDTFLSQQVPAILQSAAFQNNGLLIITWDEGASGSDGPIGMIVLSPLAKGGGYHNSVHYTHSSTLRTFLKIFGLPPNLGGAATALDLSDLFVPGAIPNGDPQVVIQDIVRAGSGSTIRWTSQPGITYRVQWKNGLTDGWQSITPDFPGTGSLISWTDNGSQTGGAGSARYFRVVVP
ncbi:MAG: alkaline phosphatase family protein [Chthoniobacterales bacterium]